MKYTLCFLVSAAVVLTTAIAAPSSPIKTITTKTITRPAPYADIPEDDGKSNFGDYIQDPLVHDYDLLVHEVAINEPSDEQQEIIWTGRFSGYEILNVRHFNIGRQRGYVNKVIASGEDLEVHILVRPNEEVRVVVEALGLRTP